VLGGVHALVLTGAAPDLAAWYPSAGGNADGDLSQAWDAFARVLDEQRDAVRDWLASPPQTNEVGRGAALIGGCSRRHGSRVADPTRRGRRQCRTQPAC